MRVADCRRCEECGAGGSGKKNLLECGGCLASFFCTTACQRNGWPSHRRTCRARRKGVVKIQARWRGWSSRRRGRRKSGDGDGEEVCEVCGRPAPEGKELNVCDGCHLSLFCSRTCQRAAWDEHKVICRERQRAAAIKAMRWKMIRSAGSKFMSALEGILLLFWGAFLGWLRIEASSSNLVSSFVDPLMTRPIAEALASTTARVLAWYCASLLLDVLPAREFIMEWTVLPRREVCREYLGEFGVKVLDMLVLRGLGMALRESIFVSEHADCSPAATKEMVAPWRAMAMSMLSKGRKSIACVKCLLSRAFMFHVKLYISMHILYVARESASQWSVFQADMMLFLSYAGDVLDVWTNQTEASGGYFLRSIDSIHPFRLFCHPCDALANPSWDVDWDLHLNVDEAEYVHSMIDIFAQLLDHRMDGGIDRHIQTRVDHVSGPRELGDGRGYTSFADPNGVPTSERWFSWDDASEYLSLRAILSRRRGYRGGSLPDLVGDYREIVSQVEPPIAELRNSGVLTTLARMLTFNEKPSLQFEAAKAINSMPIGSWFPTGNADDVSIIIPTPGDSLDFSNLLSSPIAEVREASAYVLGHVAGSSYVYRDAFLSAGAVNALVSNIYEPASDAHISQCIRVLSSFLTDEPRAGLVQIKHALPAFLHVLSNVHIPDAKVEALVGLERMISQEEHANIQAMLDAGAANAIVGALEDEDNWVVANGLRAASTIALRFAEQSLFDAGIMTKMRVVLQHSDGTVRKEACIALFSLITESQDSIETFLSERDVLAQLVDIASTDEWDVREAAIDALNAVVEFGNDEHIRRIADNGAIDAFCGALAFCETLEVTDTALAKVSLAALNTILRVGVDQGKKLFAMSNKISTSAVSWNDCAGHMLQVDDSTSSDDE